MNTVGIITGAIRWMINNIDTESLEDDDTSRIVLEYLKEKSGNLGETRNVVLGEVQELQGYEPDYGETMTTQSDGRWVEKEAVLKLLEKHFV